MSTPAQFTDTVHEPERLHEASAEIDYCATPDVESSVTPAEVGTYHLGSIDQIPVGEGRQFTVAGHDIAVFHLRSGELYATQAFCPHLAGSLFDGLIGGHTLMCPLHAWKFDMATGASLDNHCGITIYTVVQDYTGDMILELK